MRYYTSLNEILVLASYNAVLIGKGIEQKERMIELKKFGRSRLLSLEILNLKDIKNLENKIKK